MKPIIEVQGLSKRYRIGQMQGGYKTIRETLANFFRPGSSIPPPLRRPVRRSLGAGGGRLGGGGVVRTFRFANGCYSERKRRISPYA